MPVRFALDWLLTHAAPPLQYRAIAEVAKINSPRASELAYAYGPAMELAVTQQPDGRWGRTMLGIPSGRA
jgi:hypothetical protein